MFTTEAKDAIQQMKYIIDRFVKVEQYDVARRIMSEPHKVERTPSNSYITFFGQIVSTESSYEVRVKKEPTLERGIPSFTEYVIVDWEPSKEYECKLDKENGVIYFHSSQHNSSISVDYYATGKGMLSSDLIYATFDSNNHIIDTLGDMIRDCKRHLDRITTISDAEKLRVELISYIDTIIELIKIYPDASQLVKDLDRLIPLGRDVVTKLNKAIADAQGVLSQIETSQNTILNISTSNWVKDGSRYKYEYRHSLNSNAIIISAYENSGGKYISSTIDYEINSLSMITFYDTSNSRNYRISLSAGYYTGTVSDPSLIDIDLLNDSRRNVMMTRLDRELLYSNNSEISKIRLKEKSTELISKFFQKLRTNKATSFTFKGDSVFYGTDSTSSNKRPADPTPTDNGDKHKATRASVTVTEAFSKYMNRVFNNKITVKNKAYSGDSVRKGIEHWNPSDTDVVIMNYAINDANNSASGEDYVGKVDIFIQEYRKLIESELEGGAGVILCCPTKQLVADRDDIGDRTNTDVYGNAVKMLAKEYNIPCIDLQILLEGVSSNVYSDGTHLNGEGYDILGARLVGAFVGDGLVNPYCINGYDFLGSNPAIDNFKLGGTAFVGKHSAYPTPDEGGGKNEGLATYVNDTGTVTYSFYCERPNMVIIPSLYSNSSNTNVVFELDFDTKQSRLQNSWLITEDIPVDWASYPSSKINIRKSDLNAMDGKVYSQVSMRYIDEPHLLVSSRGWHTITVSTNYGNSSDGVTLYGIEMFTLEDFISRVNKKAPVELLNGTVAFDQERTPFLEVGIDGTVYLNGTIKSATPSKTNPIGQVPLQYAPKMPTTAMVSLSLNDIGAYGTLYINHLGKIFLTFTSGNVDFCTFGSVSWRRQSNFKI